MYTLLILAVLTLTTLPGIASATPPAPSHPAPPSAIGRASNSSRGDTTMDHHMRRPPPDDDREPVQKTVRRRSINIPDPDKPKINRLLKVNRNRFLEVTPDGHVVTTTSSNSVYSKLEVQFMCQLFPDQFRPCSPLLSPHRFRLADPTEGERGQDEDQRSTYSAVLLRFTESNRYLCIDESANIYTKPDDDGNAASSAKGSEPVDISECVFQHDFLPNQYDVYSSHKYPRNSSRCLRAASAASTDPLGRRPKRLDGKSRYCDRRWYIGVNRKAEVLTVKASGAPNQKAFFIQRWVHDQPSQTSPQFNVNPHREAKRPGNNNNNKHSNNNSSSSSSSAGGDGGSSQPEMDSSRKRPPKNEDPPRVSVGPPRVRSRRPVYRFLTRPSPSLFRRRSRANGYRKAAAGCSNLLRNCEDDDDPADDAREVDVVNDRPRQSAPFPHRSAKRRRDQRRKTAT